MFQLCMGRGAARRNYVFQFGDCTDPASRFSFQWKFPEPNAGSWKIIDTKGWFSTATFDLRKDNNMNTTILYNFEFGKIRSDN